MTRRSVTVDRLEGDFAVLTDGAVQVDCPVAWLPEGVAEGWTLTLSFERDADEEQRRLDDIKARQRRLSADDDGGDFSL